MEDYQDKIKSLLDGFKTNAQMDYFQSMRNKALKEIENDYTFLTNYDYDKVYSLDKSELFFNYAGIVTGFQLLDLITIEEANKIKEKYSKVIFTGDKKAD